MFEIFRIEVQILQPKAGALSHRSQLRRLQMRKAERRQIFIFQREAFQLVHHVHQLFADDFQGVVYHNRFAVTIHVAACCAEVNNRRRDFRLFAVRFYMRHYVVSDFSFVCFRHVVIDVALIFFQFVHLSPRNRQPKLRFRFRQCHPQLSPQFKTLLIRKRILHFLACIARNQRILIC